MSDTLDRLVFFTIRGLELRLSPHGLYRLVAPLGFTRAALERPEPVPGCFAKSTSRHALRRARTTFLLSRVLEFFPDRLAMPKWQSRFQTSGLDQIQEARKQGRRVVLVCFHFGTYKLTPFWLRALGVPVIALLGGNSEVRSRVKRMKDQLSPFPEIPTVLYSNDQLRSLIEVLSAGNVVLLAVDRETSRQITLPVNDRWSFRMATGAIRLASHYDAELFPCSMTDQGEWHFRLEIGRPVPREYLVNGPDIESAAQHLLQELLPGVQKRPEQSAGYLFNCFQPNQPVSLVEHSAR